MAFGVWRPRADEGTDRVNSVWTLSAPLNTRERLLADSVDRAALVPAAPRA